MIDPSLLVRLQKADPDTYEIFLDNTREFQDDDPRKDAILQHVLQDACQAKGWYWGFAVGTNAAIVSTDMQNLIKRSSKSPAEALLKCYLEAIER